MTSEHFHAAQVLDAAVVDLQAAHRQHIASHAGVTVLDTSDRYVLTSESGS